MSFIVHLFVHADEGQHWLLFRLLGQVIGDESMDLFQVLQVEALAFQDYGHHLIEGKESFITTLSLKLRNLRGFRRLLHILLERWRNEGWEVHVGLKWARRWGLGDLHVREHHVESLCLPQSSELPGLPLSRYVDGLWLPPFVSFSSYNPLFNFTSDYREAVV